MFKEVFENVFVECGIDFFVYWGNCNWGLYLEDVIFEVVVNGYMMLFVFVMSVYSLFFSCC